MPRSELPSLVLSVALALAVLRFLDKKRGLAAAPPVRLTPLAWAVGAFLFAAGVALRLFRLTDLPAALHNDEMSCGLAAREFLTATPPSLFDTGWYHTPRLSFFLTSLALRAFGDDLFGLRMSSVLLGSAALLGGAWLAGRLFGRTAGILTLVLSAAYHWHLHLSRTGFHYVQATALAVLTLATFQAATTSRRLVMFGLAGLLTGIGLQTYPAYRLVPVGLALWGLFLLLSRPSARRELLAGALAFAAVAGLVLAPLLAFYGVVPELANYRARQVVVFGDEAIDHVLGVVRHREGAETAGAVVRYQVRRAFGFFTAGRDASLQYGYAGPFVPPVLWVPFAAGLVLAARSREGPGGFVLVALTILAVLTGGVLTIDPPFSPRLSVIAGLLPVFSALALARLWDAGRGRLRLAA
ncbi:MAG TPA: glycosyltransferase family 39 protein, partial [Thermoanaerobaculia bacterium]|nr:glycosyltransferase family 39 protein [Thermoanaerobaculia bacterium]